MRFAPSSLTLAWAIAASLAVHAGIVAATFSGRARPGVAALAARTLVAELKPVQVPAAEPVVAGLPAPSVLTAAIPVPSQPPAALPAPAPPSPATPAPRSQTPGIGNAEVVGEPLADKNRLGDLMARQMAEFRVEIDMPARLDGKIVARYPAAALLAGREDSVAAWIIVDAEGVAEEIQILDGTEEFANEVLAAIRATRFQPAQNNLKPIRYPISLEFQFRTGAAQAAGATAEVK